MEGFVETPHGRIYVECEGDLSGGAVVLAAGGPGVGHDHYHPWFSRLAAQSAVVYFDYSGCGRSDRLADDREYSVALFAENLEAVRRTSVSTRSTSSASPLAGFRPSSTRSSIPPAFAGSC